MKASSPRDRVSVDLRGLRSALLAQAQARGLSPSEVVRAAVASALDGSEVAVSGQTAVSAKLRTCASARVRVSLRMHHADACSLAAAARGAGLPIGAYVAGLLTGVAAVEPGPTKAQHLAALVSSCAELATLSRNIHHLTALLQQGSLRAALEYRDMLDTVADTVHGHLVLAASVLADLRPRSAAPRPPHSQCRGDSS